MLSFAGPAASYTGSGHAAAAEQSMGMQGSFQGSGWQRWLEVSAAVEDCKLASHARRATLNLQSARAVATAEVTSRQSWSSCGLHTRLVFPNVLSTPIWAGTEDLRAHFRHFHVV